MNESCDMIIAENYNLHCIIQEEYTEKIDVHFQEWEKKL